jgi:hypothetical protein
LAPGKQRRDQLHFRAGRCRRSAQTIEIDRSASGTDRRAIPDVSQREVGTRRQSVEDMASAIE